MGNFGKIGVRAQIRGITDMVCYRREKIVKRVANEEWVINDLATSI